MWEIGECRRRGQVSVSRRRSPHTRMMEDKLDALYMEKKYKGMK